jgi:hypothetical protein
MRSPRDRIDPGQPHVAASGNPAYHGPFGVHNIPFLYRPKPHARRLVPSAPGVRTRASIAYEVERPFRPSLSTPISYRA